MNQIISLDQINQQLVAITDFRRNAGSYINKLNSLGSFFLTKDGKPVAQVTAVPKQRTKKQINDDIKKIRKLAGGFSLKVHMTPDELNADYDKMYDEMLPR